jgi:hypothetical protein
MNKDFAFTVCSNNYLAHAKTLGDSFLEFHPEFTFIIGLVDKYNDDFDYSFFSRFIIIPVDEISVPNFDELVHKYNITELNTAVKPTYLHYIFSNYNAEKVLYIDPDILITSRFEEVLSILDKKNIVITPHICSPIDDEFAPTDYHTLRGGVFNLGFIGLSNYSKVKEFINWWHLRVTKYGFADFSKSMFYDQIWINYVPVFYDNYHILKHLGYNMANWNLHERQLILKGNDFYVNENVELKFFHFSSFKYKSPDVICSYQTRYNFESRKDLIHLFHKYIWLLKKNNIEIIDKLPVFYFPNLKKSYKKISILFKVLYRIKKATKILFLGHE